MDSIKDIYFLSSIALLHSRAKELKKELFKAINQNFKICQPGRQLIFENLKSWSFIGHWSFINFPIFVKVVVY